MRDIRKTVTTSKLTLLVVGVLLFGVWMMKGRYDSDSMWSFLLIVLTTYSMAEMNVRHSLLRVRSRMVSTVFLALSVMVSEFYMAPTFYVTELFAALAIIILLYAYRRRKIVPNVYLATLLFAVSTIWDIRFVWLLPLLLWPLLSYVLNLTFKAANAMLIALLTPYWIMLPYTIFKDGGDELLRRVETITVLPPVFNYSVLPLGLVVSLILMFLLYFLASLHFLRHTYQDKLQTQNYFSFFVLQSFLLFAVIGVFPTLHEIVMPFLIVSVSPLIAHYFTFAKGKATSRFIAVIVVILMLVTFVSVLFPVWKVELHDVATEVQKLDSTDILK